jgi:hypothetical protein
MSPGYCRPADAYFGYIYIVSQREMSTSNAVAMTVYSATLFQTTTIKAQKEIAKREKKQVENYKNFRMK